MNVHRLSLIVSVLLAALSNNAALFGMLGVYSDSKKITLRKKLTTSVINNHSNEIELRNAFDYEDHISTAPKEIGHNIVTLLNPRDINNIQKVSKHWNAIGSKRVPNVYNLAVRGLYNIHVKDRDFILFCAAYDGNKAVFDGLGETAYPSYSYSWLSNINYDKDGLEEYRTFNLGSLAKSSLFYPSHLEMAFYSGDIDKVNDLLSVYDDIKKHYLGKKELISAFAIAVQENDCKCLELFTSLLKNTPVYTDLLSSYVLLLEIALRTGKKEAFEFLACNFPVKPIQYFILPSQDYIALKTALLSDNKEDVDAVLNGLGYNKESYENERDYYQLISYLTCTSTHPVDPVSHMAYVSQTVNYLNRIRKEKNWDTKAEILTKQDIDINAVVKAQLLKALYDNDLDSLKKLIGQLEENQFFFDKKQRSGENSLFSMHVDLLKKARQLNNKEAFFLLSCLRLTVGFSDMSDEYMMSLYEKYSKKVDYEKGVMKAKQSLLIKDKAYAYVAESLFG